MTYIGKLAAIMGGAALLAGCGSSQSEFSGANAQFVAAQDSPLTFAHAGATNSTDRLIGYYFGCKSPKNDNVAWEMLFGADNTGKADVTVGDNQCKLFATYLERNSGTVANPVIEQYRLKDSSGVNDLDVQIVASASDTLYKVAMAVSVADSTKSALVGILGSSLDFPAGGYSVNVTTGATLQSLNQAQAAATFIGYSKVSASIGELAPPNYNIATTAAVIVDSDKKIVTVTGNFTLSQPSSGAVAGQELVWGAPGSIVAETSTGTTALDSTSFAALSEGKRYQILSDLYKLHAASRKANITVSSPQLTAQSLYPVNTDLSTNFTPQKTQNLIIVRRMQNQVISYQGLLTKLTTP